MNSFSISPVTMVSSLYKNRLLIYTLSKREIIGRYKGSILGLFWSFFNPVFMLCIYTFVFSVVFKTKWGSDQGSHAEFALILFSGLLAFNIFSECTARAPSTIISNANYVKKVIFPLEIISWVVINAAVFHTAVSLFVWVIFYTIAIGVPHITILLFPFTVLPLLFIVNGLIWLLGSVGVFIRDIGQLVNILITVTMFVSPIFFPITAVPEKYRNILSLNPMAHVITDVREVLIWGRIPNLYDYAVFLSISLLFCWFGFAWFQKTRKGFADVI